MVNEDSEGKEMEIVQIFKDLKKEMNKIRADKSKLEGDVVDVNENLKSIQEKEMELREMITNFAEKESGLNNKRIKLEKQLSNVTTKLEKLSKVQKELTDIWS